MNRVWHAALFQRHVHRYATVRLLHQRRIEIAFVAFGPNTDAQPATLHLKAEKPPISTQKKIELLQSHRHRKKSALRKFQHRVRLSCCRRGIADMRSLNGLSFSTRSSPPLLTGGNAESLPRVASRDIDQPHSIFGGSINIRYAEKLIIRSCARVDGALRVAYECPCPIVSQTIDYRPVCSRLTKPQNIEFLPPSAESRGPSQGVAGHAEHTPAPIDSLEVQFASPSQTETALRLHRPSAESKDALPLESLGSPLTFHFVLTQRKTLSKAAREIRISGVLMKPTMPDILVLDRQIYPPDCLMKSAGIAGPVAGGWLCSTEREPPAAKGSIRISP